MKDKKQNVFDDFIAAGEWLIANHYTSSKELAIEGGSNGGLLVGAALTQRPDLFRAVICQYPLLDMLRYQKFMKGSFWVPEYGSADDPAEFQYLRAYSPYHNVKDSTNYPSVLFITGDGDTRVAPLHARKMAARLQVDFHQKSRPPALRHEVRPLRRPPPRQTNRRGDRQHQLPLFAARRDRKPTSLTALHSTDFPGLDHFHQLVGAGLAPPGHCVLLKASLSFFFPFLFRPASNPLRLTHPYTPHHFLL